MLRSYMFIVMLTASCLIFSSSTTVCSADENSSQENPPITPVAQWDVSTAFVMLPSADLHGSALDVGINDYRVKFGRNFRINEPLTLSIGGGYALKHIDAPAAARLPSDLHSLTLELGGSYQLSPRSFFSIKATPGLYSDFEGSGGDKVRMPLLLLGGYRFHNGFSAVAGLVYRFGYHSNPFIPVLGFSYQPNQQWRFDAVAPRPAITYTASRRFKIFVAGDFASDEYGVNGNTYGAKVLRYSDLKLSGGVTYVPIPPFKISAAVGYAFDRQFSYYDGTRAAQSLDNVPFFRLSVDLDW